MQDTSPHLTDIAFYSRLALKWGVIALILLLILKITLSAALDWYRKNNPTQPRPTVSFGLLPSLTFPPSQTGFTSDQLTYKLETVTGKLPDFPHLIKVYPAISPARSFLSYQRMLEAAGRLNFKKEPVKIEEARFLWRFSDETFPARTLDYQETTNNFSLKYDYHTDPTPLHPEQPSVPHPSRAIQEALSYLSKPRPLPSDVQNGTQEIILLKIANNEFIPAISFSEAEGALINFYRQNLNNLLLIHPDPHKSLISVLIGPNRGNRLRFLEVNFHYQQFDHQKSATYPLKTATTAFEDLKQGKGFLASFTGTRPQTTIREVFLAYYVGASPQEFLQPVIVFQGDDDFLAYVPAITEEWQKK